VDGKTGEREIPISDETRRLLLALASGNGKDDFVFHSQRGTLTPSGMYQIVQKHMLKAGIAGPKLGPHRCRHAFGKNYIKNGGDTRSLQEIMGHTNISTTEIYVELSKDEIVAKHHLYTPLRSVHAAAQYNLLDKACVLKEAEKILEERRAPHGNNSSNQQPV
jgi:site-specific recombinase XerD